MYFPLLKYILEQYTTQSKSSIKYLILDVITNSYLCKKRDIYWRVSGLTFL